MSSGICRICTIGLLLCTAVTSLASEEAKVPHPDWPVVYKDDFESGSTAGYEPTDPKAWKVTREGGNSVYCLTDQSQYKPAVRSPVNISLVKNLDVSDFVLDVKIKSTKKEYGHRDMCLFFGHQDPTHFYYIHIASAADPHAHSIFLVNNEPRVSIAKDRTKGVQWGDTWHHIRVVRDAASGSVEVYFDDMTKPVMSTTDKTFTHGRIGLGSFDDVGCFDDLVVRGKRHEQ